MSEFKGWTPETVDNLTFSQLESITRVLNKREKSKGRDVPKEKSKVKGFPASKMTSVETKAWIDAGMPSPASKFVKELRKKK